MARLEAIRRGADDAIMLDAGGFVAEASAANLFIVRCRWRRESA
jgi:branched-subunit amino acid aminotransferase/4-amino-4-deoxychorismate lyase